MGGWLSRNMSKMSSSSNDRPKIIAVFGATGSQGGSLAQALLGDNSFKLRAITRDPDSQKSKALAEKGAEVVKADQDDPESLRKALEGAHGVFAVTNYWEHQDRDREIQQGKNIADACKATDVKHVVFCSLENIKEAIGKDSVLYDNKASIDAYMKKIGLPLTSVRFAFYAENFTGLTKPIKDETDENTWILNLPLEGKPFDTVVVSETGECTRQIFKGGKKWIGKTVGYASWSGTIDEYAAILTKHVEGKTFKAGTITAEEFGQLPIPGASLFAVVLEAIQQGKIVRDIKTTKQLNPNISDFETWVIANKDKLVEAFQ